MNKKLSPTDVKILEKSLLAIEEGKKKLREKERRILTELGRVYDKDMIIYNDEKYKVFRTVYKCQKYKEDGELGKPIFYIPVEEVE